MHFLSSLNNLEISAPLPHPPCNLSQNSVRVYWEGTRNCELQNYKPGLPANTRHLLQYQLKILVVSRIFNISSKYGISGKLDTDLSFASLFCLISFGSE